MAMHAGSVIEAGYKFAKAGQWKNVLYELAGDFCIPEYYIDRIIRQTQIECATDDQEILYRNAHRTFMTLLESKWRN